MIKTQQKKEEKIQKMVQMKQQQKSIKGEIINVMNITLKQK